MRYSTHSYKRYRLSVPVCTPVQSAYAAVDWLRKNSAKDALAFFMELGRANIAAKLCQGTILKGTRKKHAWVEVDGKVYDYYTLGVSKDCWVSDTNAVSTA